MDKHHQKFQCICCAGSEGGKAKVAEETVDKQRKLLPPAMETCEKMQKLPRFAIVYRHLRCR